MTGETFFQLHYHLTDTERLFDLAQGIAARRRWLKKHDARCRSFTWYARGLLRRNYRHSWQQFRQQNGPDGTVNFDADGIREENEKGKPTHFDWADWDVCVVTPKVIVLTFRTPVLLFFPYSREAAITVAHAARAFGKEGGLVYRKRI